MTTPTPTPRTELDFAILFHETYERLAPSFGYETRPDTRAFDPESKNGRLMLAVMREVAMPLASELATAQSERERLVSANEHWHLRVTQERQLREQAESALDALKAHAEAMHNKARRVVNGHAQVAAVEALESALDAYRAAHPKDAP